MLTHLERFGIATQVLRLSGDAVPSNIPSRLTTSPAWAAHDLN